MHPSSCGARLDIRRAAEQLQRDDVWIDLAARFMSWRAAAAHELEIASSALSALANGPYRRAPAVAEAARALAASVQDLRADDRPPPDDVQLLTNLRAAQRVLRAIYNELARGG
ncbi:MAG: hypothetical protein ACMG6S_11595 [Byssovorax sp.]